MVVGTLICGDKVGLRSGTSSAHMTLEVTSAIGKLTRLTSWCASRKLHGIISTYSLYTTDCKQATFPGWQNGRRRAAV